MTAPADQSTFEYALAKVAEHFMDVMYFDLSRYLIAAGLLTAFLLVVRKWAGNRRIQKRSAGRQDYVREIASSLRTVFVFGVTTLTTLVGTEVGIIKLNIENAALITIIWQFALIVVLHDAYFYWIHRAMHSKRLFRATHLHHHKSRTPTPWAAYSFSSWEAMLEAAFMPLFLLATSLLGIAYAGFAVFLFLWHMIIRNVMAHAGHELFPAGWVDNPLTDWISTTTHHDLHHSEGHNYGFYFTWWDRWMGTEHPEYKARFREVAKPLVISHTLAGRTSIVAMALVTSIAVLAGPFAGVEAGMI
ncbi:sterol desaturase family protein [Erythrobacter sp. THAF29]|uniref:sterol desaturase family protein n=1 Tax=Erythrobacter sp. THAF29 TaxID=2587851 RepID=UPI0012687A5E|nr:sterol desaturase family protein [Erythrobacter sp. THAF29]QFT77301.1 Fatty acid hydroxylase superfamily protein [Erythrobacter sp. THAF29]